MRAPMLLMFVFLLFKAEMKSQQVDYPGAIARFIPNCNYSFGRNTNIDTWVNHWIGVGTYAGAISWFNNCNANSSAHFIIRASDGEVSQLVGVSNTAWHCGAVGFPLNNTRSIGVEHEATLSNPGLWNSNAMLISSTNMTCYFINQYGIPNNRSLPGIREHNEMPGTNTQCAGNIPWALWLDLLNSSLSSNCNNSSISNCPNNLIINTNFISGNEIRRANDFIISNSDIEAGANVEFGANNEITLEQGFHAKPGSQFKANTNGCSP